MRRLPLYFLVDTCLSMSGKNIEMVEKCINGVIKRMRQDPYLIETNFLSIYTYGNNKVTVIESYKLLMEIEFQKFCCSGYSNINYGLEAIKEDYNKNFIKTTFNEKGDWKPMLFVFTGIAPSTKIDNTLVEFFERNFSTGFGENIEDFIDEEFEYKSHTANKTFIVTSENEFVKNSFKSYFTNIFSYEDIDSFIYRFNNFFKWSS